MKEDKKMIIEDKIKLKKGKEKMKTLLAEKKFLLLIMTTESYLTNLRLETQSVLIPFLHFIKKNDKNFYYSFIYEY